LENPAEMVLSIGKSYGTMVAFPAKWLMTPGING
jgi:hypothetical protein